LLKILKKIWNVENFLSDFSQKSGCLAFGLIV